MPVIKNYLIKEVGSKKNADGLVVVVTLVTPPKTVNGMPLISVEQPIVIEVPTTAATLAADLAAYDTGNLVPATFGPPVPPAPTPTPAAA